MPPPGRRLSAGELDAVARCARWLWLLWRLLLFSALLASPVPLSVPAGLLRLGEALRSLGPRLAPRGQRAETPYPFGPDDGERLRPGYRARHGPMGSLLVQRLGHGGLRHQGPRLGPPCLGGLPHHHPKEYLTPPGAATPSSGPQQEHSS